jgi:hypothetical protein
LVAAGLMLILDETRVSVDNPQSANIKIIDLTQAVAGTENFGNLDRMTTQNADLMVRDVVGAASTTAAQLERNLPARMDRSDQIAALKAPAAPDAGVNDQQFLEQNTIRAKSTAYGSESSSVEHHPVTGLPMWTTDLQAVPGPGAGVNDQQFLEQNTIRAKSRAYD